MAAMSTATVAPVLDANLTLEKRSSAADRIAAASTSTEVRIVEPREYKQAAACLAEAFRDDHVVRYSIDTPDRIHLTDDERFKMHVDSMEYVTYAHCLNGLVLTIGEDFDCVALWLPPGKNIDDWWTIIRSGMWRLNWSLSQEGKERFFKEFLPLLGRSKAEVMGERDGDSWYLNYIGTKPSARGKGYAKKLVGYVTDQVEQIALLSRCRC